MSKKDNVMLVHKIRAFFNEFNFRATNSFRFINTLTITAKNGNFTDFTNYIINYFKLTYNSYLNEVIEKMKSPEFKSIYTELRNIEIPVTINTRFKIYFGDAGVGKTTKAIKENPDAIVMLCSSDYDSDDLFKDFDFEDGKPVYQKSNLRVAMENGKKIILEEMNLLKIDCLRTIQGVLDNKSIFNWKGKEITVAKGFEVIATLNLEVNDTVYELPAPLVDRASELIEFVPTDELIAEIAFKGEGSK